MTDQPPTLGSTPVLVLIDVQCGFDQVDHWGGNRNNPDAEKNMGVLLELFRAKQKPVIHVKHDSDEEVSPLRPDNAGNAIKPFAAPKNNEPVIGKNVNSGFIGTNLEQQLRELQATSVVIVGLTTDHCVSTTTRMSGNLGFKTFLVNDAVATFDKTGFDGKVYPAQLIHETALASLHKEFATVLNTTDLVKLLD